MSEDIDVKLKFLRLARNKLDKDREEVTLKILCAEREKRDKSREDRELRPWRPSIFTTATVGFYAGVGFTVLAYAACLKSDDSQREAGAGNVQAHNVYDDRGQEYRVVDGNLREPANTMLGADNPLCVERHHPSGSIRTCAYEKNTRLRVEFYDPGGELQRQATIDALMTDDSVQEYVKQYIKDSSLLRNAGLMH